MGLLYCVAVVVGVIFAVGRAETSDDVVAFLWNMLNWPVVVEVPNNGESFRKDRGSCVYVRHRNSATELEMMNHWVRYDSLWHLVLSLIVFPLCSIIYVSFFYLICSFFSFYSSLHLLSSFFILPFHFGVFVLSNFYFTCSSIYIFYFCIFYLSDSFCLTEHIFYLISIFRSATEFFVIKLIPIG